MPRNLRRTRLRLTLAYALSFGAVVVAVVVALWLAVGQATLGPIDSQLQLQLPSVRTAIDHRFDPAPERLDRSANLPGTSPDGTAVDAAFVAAGEVVAFSPESPRDQAVVDAAGLGEGIHSAELGGPARILVAAFRDARGTAGVIVLRVSLAQHDAAQARLGVALGVAVLLLIAAAGGVGYAVAGAALRPVRRSFESLRRFSADAAHELRTPLTLMRTELDVALSRPRGAGEYRASLEGVLGDVEHLSGLVERLLVVARADAGMLSAGAEEIDLARLVQDCTARWSATASARGVSIRSDVPGGLRVDADPGLLRQLLDNLVENATRHSPQGGEVRIDATRDTESWTLRVDDSGPGIPGELRERIFERFVRGDSGRTRAEGGAGLGLAVCRAIADAHGGAISVGSSDDGGARVEVRLPLRKDEAALPV